MSINQARALKQLNLVVLKIIVRGMNNGNLLGIYNMTDRVQCWGLFEQNDLLYTAYYAYDIPMATNIKLQWLRTE